MVTRRQAIVSTVGALAAVSIGPASAKPFFASVTSDFYDSPTADVYSTIVAEVLRDFTSANSLHDIEQHVRDRLIDYCKSTGVQWNIQVVCIEQVEFVNVEPHYLLTANVQLDKGKVELFKTRFFLTTESWLATRT